MPKQDNYGQRIAKTWGFRPRRIDDRDWDLIAVRDENGNPLWEDVTFGTSKDDVAEIWIYDDINQIVAHTNLHPSDEAIRLTRYQQAPTDSGVGVGNDETPDMIEIHWPKVMTRLELPEGRYFATINFFRNEVGSETNRNDPNVPGDKLFIGAISPSRTELRLEPVQQNDRLARQIREFAQPSVPPHVAQALTDQLFAHASVTASFAPDGTALATDPVRTITQNFSRNARHTAKSVADRVSDASRDYEGDTNRRIVNSGLKSLWNMFLNDARLEIRNKIINKLQDKLNKGDNYIRENEFQKLINEAIDETLKQLAQSELNDGPIAGRIQLTNLGS